MSRKIFSIFVLLFFCLKGVFATTVTSELAITQVNLKHVIEDYYSLDVSSRIVMSDEQVDMLNNGIPLTYIYEVKIKEHVYAFWNKNKVDQKFRFELRYHGLSKQYVVKDLRSEKQESFPTLSLAISSISEMENVSLQLRKRDQIKYKGYIKLWLDIEALPAPLRIPAYLSKNWRLNSGWKQWDI